MKSRGLASKRNGFSLIELLVVIAIIAVLTAVGLSNFLGARERARDVKKKAELTQLRNALRLYYNDFQTYPAANGSNTGILGCGVNGASDCASTCGSSFAAGGTGCQTVYMKYLPDFNGTTVAGYGWNYYLIAGGDDFTIRTTLDNTSDPDIAESHARCPSANCSAATDYCMCAQ